LVTWFTFLPSFIFILAGGPLVESTHRNLKFTAPLTAITAAVVGVILNLALFFGYHLLWPQGFGGTDAQALSSCQWQDPLCMGFDWRSALIAVGAAVALFKYKRSVMQVIGVCALIGLAIKTLPI
jgi:chromate transporter